MKIRRGFVSNSSSSSFVLIGKNLTGDSDIIQKLKFPDAGIFGVWYNCGTSGEEADVIHPIKTVGDYHDFRNTGGDVLFWVKCVAYGEAIIEVTRGDIERHNRLIRKQLGRVGGPKLCYHQISGETGECYLGCIPKNCVKCFIYEYNKERIYVCDSFMYDIEVKFKDFDMVRVDVDYNCQTGIPDDKFLKKLSD